MSKQKVAKKLTYRITTNNLPRQLKTWLEVPPKVREFDFDYMEAGDYDDPRFFQAYGVWFDYNEIMIAPNDLKAQGWDGYSGIGIGCCYVFKYFDEFGDTLENPIAGFATYQV